jgi:Zn-dependent protease with chaperone function
MKMDLQSIPIKKKLLCCIITFYAGYFYCTLPYPWVKLLCAVILFFAAEAMAFFWVPSIVDGAIEGFKFRFSLKTLPWITPPAYLKCAQSYGVKLDKKRPFSLVANLDNAFADGSSRSVAFGDRLYYRLGREERFATLGHELTHLKKNHSLWMMVVIMLASISVISVLSRSNADSAIVLLTTASLGIFLFTALSWISEYEADEGAVRLFGKQATLSLLRKLRPPSQWHKASASHPSISQRIARIEKFK